MSDKLVKTFPSVKAIGDWLASGGSEVLKGFPRSKFKTELDLSSCQLTVTSKTGGTVPCLPRRPEPEIEMERVEGWQATCQVGGCIDPYEFVALDDVAVAVAYFKGQGWKVLDLGRDYTGRLACPDCAKEETDGTED